jgi:hypothetical protein
MKKIKQEYREVNGIEKAICKYCGQVVIYPEGVYLRNGLQVHIKCIQNKRGL